MWAWIIGGVVALITLISVFQYRSQSGTYRPLSKRQPARQQSMKRPLGTEALDLKEVHRTQRRNESLERAHTNWTRGKHRLTGLEVADTDVTPLADDESYAKRYFTAFYKNKD